MLWIWSVRERVENPLVEACALRGASEHGEEGVRELAWRVQIEAQSHVKDFVPSLVVCVNAAGSARGVHSGRSERRARCTSLQSTRPLMIPRRRRYAAMHPDS